MSRTVIIILSITLILVIILLIICILVSQTQFTFYYIKDDEIIKDRINLFDNIRGEVHINKIAIIGSHDSLTYSIMGKKYITDPDGYEYPSLDAFLPRRIVPSVIRRLSVSQYKNIYDQLLCGVRFLDFRISYIDIGKGMKFYATHELVGDEITKDLKDIVEFMKQTNDFVIVNVRILKNNTNKTEKFIQLVKEVGLYDYFPSVDPPVATKPLSEMRKRVILLLNIEEGKLENMYNDNEILSEWGYASDIDTLKNNIASNITKYKEKQAIVSDKFYVNQLQMSFDGNYLMAIRNFSLLHMARRSNSTLELSETDVNIAPILYVDNVGTATKIFNVAQNFNKHQHSNTVNEEALESFSLKS